MPAMNPTQIPEPFDVRQLRILMQLASEKSLSAAARKLHLTQSAISHALRKLEEDAGVRLVERNEKGAELTPAGQLLRRRAVSIFNEMQEARQDLRQLQNWGQQRLRLAASSTACQYLLPGWLSLFREKQPRCHIEICSGNLLARLTQLREGRVDLAIVTHTGLSAPDLEMTFLGKEDLCLIASPNSLLEDGSLPKETPYIGYQRGSSLAEDSLLWFDAAERPQPRTLMEVESLDAIKALVKAQLGYAVVPRWVVAPEIAAGDLWVDPSNIQPTREWSLVMRKGHQVTLSEAEWIRLVLAQSIQVFV